MVSCHFSHCVTFHRKSLGRSSGELTGSKKERRQRRPQRRQRMRGLLSGRPARGCFLLSAIAATFIGTTRTPRIFQNCQFVALSKGLKRLAVSEAQGDFCPGNGGSPHRRYFDRSSPSSTSPAQRTLFLIGLISVLLVDFLDAFVQGLGFCRPVL